MREPLPLRWGSNPQKNKPNLTQVGRVLTARGLGAGFYRAVIADAASGNTVTRQAIRAVAKQRGVPPASVARQLIRRAEPAVDDRLEDHAARLIGALSAPPKRNAVFKTLAARGERSFNSTNLLGRVGELAFIEHARPLIHARGWQMKDVAGEKQAGDIVVACGDETLFRIDVKAHATRFEAARERTGIDPDVCCALSNGKIRRAVFREELVIFAILPLVKLGVSDLDVAVWNRMSAPQRKAMQLVSTYRLPGLDELVEATLACAQPDSQPLWKAAWRDRRLPGPDRTPFRMMSASKAGLLSTRPETSTADDQQRFQRTQSNTHVALDDSATVSCRHLFEVMLAPANFDGHIAEQRKQKALAEYHLGDHSDAITTW